MTSPTSSLLEHGVWRIDPAGSHVWFAIRHLRVATVRGRFRSFTARVREVGDGLRIDGREGAVRVVAECALRRSEFGLEWTALRQAGRLVVADLVRVQVGMVLAREPRAGGPMKRSAALAPLSRDHHVALQEALRLRRATETDIAVAAARFVAFWRRSGARHFQVEEEIVLQALPPGDPEWDATVARVRAEHAEITLRAEALDDVDVDAARALGETLTAHVRFEERVVFPQLARALDDKRLGALGAAVEAAERPRRPAGP
jgi:hypothetical protein